MTGHPRRRYMPTCSATAAATRWRTPATIREQSRTGSAIAQFSTRCAIQSWCRRGLRTSIATDGGHHESHLACRYHRSDLRRLLGRLASLEERPRRPAPARQRIMPRGHPSLLRAIPAGNTTPRPLFVDLCWIENRYKSDACFCMGCFSACWRPIPRNWGASAVGDNAVRQ